MGCYHGCLNQQTNYTEGDILKPEYIVCPALSTYGTDNNSQFNQERLQEALDGDAIIIFTSILATWYIYEGLITV
jgi:hypothetical protein